MVPKGGGSVNIKDYEYIFEISRWGSISKAAENSASPKAR